MSTIRQIAAIVAKTAARIRAMQVTHPIRATKTARKIQATLQTQAGIHRTAVTNAACR